jgi:hypothetical protein
VHLASDAGAGEHPVLGEVQSAYDVPIVGSSNAGQRKGLNYYYYFDTKEAEVSNLDASQWKNKPELEFLNNLWGARHRVGMGLSYRPARLHRLVEFIPWNRCLDSINV